VGTWQGDPSTDTYVLDERAQELTGLGEQVTSEAVKRKLHPDYRDQVRAAYQRFRDPEWLGAFSFEAPVATDDGSTRWLSLRGRITSARFGGRWVEGVVLDVTEIRAAEAELERLAASLERRVDERTAQVRKLAADLTHAEQAERQRVAEVLHDDLQQLLYALQIRADLLGETLDPPQRDLAAEFSDLLARAVQTTRSLTVDLSPPVQQGEGLEGSLEWLALQFQTTQDVEVEIVGHADVAEPDIHTLLFRSVRELLFNVVKHANVGRATVRLGRTADLVRIEVEDRGEGFDLDRVDARARGFGLFSVRERLGLIGGRGEIESAPGEGTRVTITCPVGEHKEKH
jgi:PAS domain S-box-containing protein